ncbi:MAG: CO dehydrogenase/acetyl-CoA synthase complex subunit epsilon [Candidatus Methanomethylicota archaeon]|uniref:CO dehydrogenase/acetyl-CoA synthase complex subunit epsilon n=1 Tax=Thermoproteota archaeon TaxID=2056631 RepID=A0A497ELV2_9CREN|nr:MAG: CO dehydrogenase/acetyl-CoA synthase complex subunit epsilon [Candidatus Verstraetearchaeota archaeon]
MAYIPPWQTGAVYGAHMALPIKGEAAGVLIMRAKNPLLVIGHEAKDAKVGEQGYLNFLVRLARTCNLPVVATANLVKELKARKLRQVYSISALELLNKLHSPEWSVNGLGRHDLVIFAGLQYQLQMQILSSIKHFAKGIKTMTLDRYFYANADYSFPNLSEETWQSTLNSLLSSVEEFRRKMKSVS